MNVEDALLFHCIRQKYGEEQRRAVIALAQSQPIRWEYVFKVAEAHGVAPLVYLNLVQNTPHAGLEISPEVIQKFKLYAYRNTLIKEKNAAKLTEVLQFFNQKSIRVMLVKGSALDCVVYQQPWYTFSKDMDLLIDQKEEDVPEELLKEIRHLFQGWNIEYEFYEHHDLNIDGLLPIDFKSIWRDANKIQFRDQGAWVMSPEDLLISICINSCRKRFFRLKSLCDIAETIEKFPELNWETLTAKAREYDCRNIVYAALLVTQKALGCSLPPGALDSLGISWLRRFFIGITADFLQFTTSLDMDRSGRVGLLGRYISIFLLLPYATYSWRQLWRKAAILFRTRNTPLKAW